LIGKSRVYASMSRPSVSALSTGSSMRSGLITTSKFRSRLIARVATLEEEARSLASLTAEVDDRLDGAIAEIREVLARN